LYLSAVYKCIHAFNTCSVLLPLLSFAFAKAKEEALKFGPFAFAKAKERQRQYIISFFMLYEYINQLVPFGHWLFWF